MQSYCAYLSWWASLFPVSPRPGVLPGYIEDAAGWEGVERSIYGSYKLVTARNRLRRTPTSSPSPTPTLAQTRRPSCFLAPWRISEVRWHKQLRFVSSLLCSEVISCKIGLSENLRIEVATDLLAVSSRSRRDGLSSAATGTGQASPRGAQARNRSAASARRKGFGSLSSTCGIPADACP